jgi:hypothetical protein
MIRIVQISAVIVALLVARRVLYGWLRQEDSLPRLLRQGLDALLLYFIYVAAGMFVFSLLAGRGFGEDGAIPAILLTLGGAAYVGIGIAWLWLHLARHETRRK